MAEPVIDATIAGGVQLNEIECPTRPISLAAITLIAWVSVLGARAVNRLGKETARCGLAGASRSREQVGVRHPTRLDGVRERAGHDLLSGQLRERMRTPLPVEDFRTHRKNRRFVTGSGLVYQRA